MAPEHRHTTGRSLVLSLFCLLCVSQQVNTDCDQTFVSRPSGVQTATFSAPVLFNPLGHSRQCIYTFVAGAGQRVDLFFTTFNLRGTPPECAHEFLDVYAEVGGGGATAGSGAQLIDSPWGGRYCGPIPPRRRVSLRRVLALVFTTDKNQTTADLFTGRYTFINDSVYEIGIPITGTPCSFTIQPSVNKTGILLSPTYPGAYPKDLTCQYQFLGATNQRIRIEFRDFDLFFGGPHCPFDYVKVFDGLDNSSALIGTYCGQQRNLVLYSSESSLFVVFSTLARTANTQNRGFKGIFEFSESFVKLDFIRISGGEHIRGSECDQKILSKRESTGFVVSPNYPLLYIQKTVCRYFIYGMQDAQHLERVKLQFTKFNIPKKDKEESCTDGYLKIYLKGQEVTESYDKFDYEVCGEKMKPDTIISDGPRLVLVFSSGDNQGQGFKATYTFETEYRIPGTAAPDGSCTFTYLSTSRKKGDFNSPRYPSNYPSSTNCTYTFLATPNEQVAIVFDNFKVRADNANTSLGFYGESICQEDWLEIYNMYRDGTEQLIGRYCSTTAPGPVESNMGAVGLKVFLHADAEAVYSGFKARYMFEPAKAFFGDCGGNISGEAGIITTPNFPEKYDAPGKGMASKTCNWHINVRPKKRILLNFERFGVEGNPPERGCPAAVARLWYRTDNIPIELCGEKGVADNWQYLSDTNTMRITFITADKSVGALGFKAVWTEVTKTPTCEQFQCSQSGFCIAERLRCNLVGNCGAEDTSDEDGCFPELPPTDYTKLYQAIAVGIILVILIIIITCWRRHRSKRLAREAADEAAAAQAQAVGGLPPPGHRSLTPIIPPLPSQIPPPPAIKELYPSPIAGPSTSSGRGGGIGAPMRPMTVPHSIRFSYVSSSANDIDDVASSATTAVNGERYVNDDSV